MDIVIGLMMMMMMLFTGVRFYIPNITQTDMKSVEEWQDHNNIIPLNVLQLSESSNHAGVVNLSDARARASDIITQQRQHTVKKMMKHAWNNYVRYAWGKDELQPVSKQGRNAGIFGSQSLGATIVDGLDTLYIMGMMDEFKQGRDWVKENLNFNNMSSDVSLFHVTTQIMGGLLSCYTLTGDVMFRDKASQLAEKLLPAFQSQTGIPYSLVNLKTGWSKNYGWVSGACSILAEIGGLHLEFTYLSNITNNPVYRAKVDHIRDVLKNIDKPNGLYPNYLDPKTGKWGQDQISLGGLGDSFYEYLLKSWLQSGKVHMEVRQMYDDAIENILKHMMLVSLGGLTYITDRKFGGLENKMEHLACFSGGLIGLGAHTQQNDKADYYINIAERLTNTCHEAYNRTATKLAPNVFRFTESVEAMSVRRNEKNYILQPQTFESYFILWRLTKNPKYREWGWEAIQALEKHCRVSGGYSGLWNVYLEIPQNDDVQQSFFLAETLKYLYLLFSDDDLISLDQWVFNTGGHPLPIKGANPYYRQFKV